VAQAERDARDPVKRAQAIRESKIDDALDQWISGLKLKSDPTRSAYATFKRVLLDWAASKHYEVLSDVTADALDAWVASWSPDAERKENKLKANTQKFRVARIRSFFEWAYRIQKIPINPAVTLRTIRITKEDTEETQPLTPTQFDRPPARGV
jgi:site-specific recombinase XerD